MRSLFVFLLVANLIVFGAQFSVVRRAVFGDDGVARPVQLNAERLRIIRDTSARPGPAQAQPINGTNRQ